MDPGAVGHHDGRAMRNRLLRFALRCAYTLAHGLFSGAWLLRLAEGAFLTVQLQPSSLLCASARRATATTKCGRRAMPCVRAGPAGRRSTVHVPFDATTSGAASCSTCALRRDDGARPAHPLIIGYV